MRCEGIIPEAQVVVGCELVEIAPVRYEDRESRPARYELRDGEPVQVEPPVIEPVMVEAAVHEQKLLYRTDPEHPCPAEATMLARSMKQEMCSLGEYHWVQDGPDRAYCEGCFKPGTVTDRNGNTTLHPTMSTEHAD